MGRPYVDELEQLTACYAEGVNPQAFDATILADIGFLSDAPFVVVGSGGALSAAKFIVSLRENITGKPARLATPLEIISNPALCLNASVLIVSAGGSNKDIVAAFTCAADTRTEKLTVFCTKKTGKIVQLSHRHPRAKAFVFPTGGKKDGFLALNSILSFALNIARPCAAISGNQLPGDFASLRDEVLTSLSTQKESRDLWGKTYIVVMHGLSTHAAAFDFESKATEAGLISSLVNDHRNFGHGRHHWIAKHGPSTGILALSGPEDRALAAATLRVIPGKIPRVHATFVGDFITVALKSLIAVFYLIKELGEQKGIDPGRPGVPAFGSKIYSLGPKLLVRDLPQESPIESAVSRKIAALGLSPQHRPVVLSHAKQALDKLQSSRFCGAALDFDGTLVETSLRYEPIPPHVIGALEHLLELGGILAICTGRGKSAHVALRASIEKRYWEQVAVSFYNGATLCRLSDEITSGISLVDKSELIPIRDSLQILVTGMSSTPGISGTYSNEVRDTQVTFRPTSAQNFPILLRHIQERLALAPSLRLKCLRSSHSIDVIPNGVSKVNAIAAAARLFKCAKHLQFLRVGDMGDWPGNDSELLDHFAGLSVDRVSANLLTAWNFSPRGLSNTESLAQYLGSFVRETNGELGWSLSRRSAMRQ